MADLVHRPRPRRADPRVLVFLAGLGIMSLRQRMSQTMPPVPQWLTLPEASAHSGLSVALIRRLITTGRLMAVKDRAIKVRRSDLDSLDCLSELSRSSVDLTEAAGKLRLVVKERRQ